MISDNLKSQIKNVQSRELAILLEQGTKTQYFATKGATYLASYEEYSQKIPIVEYSDLESYVEEMKLGGENILWPGKCSRYAVSSGTSGKGKHIPVTDARLKSDQRFFKEIQRFLLSNLSLLSWIKGRILSLSGSVERQGYILIGEITGHLAATSPWLAQFLVKPNPRKTAFTSWEKKWTEINRIITKSHISGLIASPVWVEKLLETHPKLHKELSFLVMGGMSPNRTISQFQDSLSEKLILETYGASEAYIAWGKWENSPHLAVVLDNGAFFECEETEDSGKVIPLWEIQQNTEYRLIITSNSGLWRYRTDDIVKFSENEFNLIVEHKRRAHEELNRYGEQISVSDLEKVQTHLGVNFKVGYDLEKDNLLFIHHEDSQKMRPEDVDKALRYINRHYNIRRETGAMLEPRIVKAKSGSAFSRDSKRAQAKDSIIFSDFSIK